MAKETLLRLSIFLALLISTSPLSPALRTGSRWIVWNVGQGQWITHVGQKECWHLDAGGEFFPPPQKLRNFCLDKTNRLYLSHWDWDHIGGIRHLRTHLHDLCLAAKPGGETTSLSRKKLIQSLTPCQEPDVSSLQELHWPVSPKSSNHSSRVWVWNDQWLFPGDSPMSEEKKWVTRIPRPHRVQVFLVGHHGSKTSTSKALLKQLTGLRVAIVSARMKRYGHPHPKVVERLFHKKIPILRTEEWGHLVFEIDSFKD